MKRTLYVLICVAYFASPLSSFAQPAIKILVTSAMLAVAPEIREMRNGEYAKSMQILSDYGYRPYVVEACQSHPPSLFEAFTRDIVCSNVNDYSLRNKGVNETRSIIEAFKYFNFDDEDMVLKLTGRYFFSSRDFLTMVEENPQIDVFVNYDYYESKPDFRMKTGCFALRGKFYKEFLRTVDLERMEKQMIDVEIEMADFIRKISREGAQIMVLDKLGITAHVGGGTYPPVYSYW